MILPLVALHGFTGSPRSFAPLLQRLGPSTARRAFVPALMGHGDAAAVRSRAFADEVDRLAKQISHRGFSGSHLIGYSLGARMALGLMARHPQLIGRVTLIGVNPGLRSHALREQRRRSDERWCGLLSKSLVAFVSKWESQPLFLEQQDLSAQAILEQKLVRNSQDPEGLKQSLRTVGLGQMPDYWAIAKTWRRRLTLVTGERDSKFCKLAKSFVAPVGAVRPPSIQEHWTVPRAGHNLLLEAPGELARMLTQ